MIFKLKSEKNKFIEEVYEKSMKELDEFFRINWNKNIPALIIVPDRKTFNKILRQKTANWHVAESKQNIVFILSPKAYKEQSSHNYSNKEYYSTIKHELCHQFQDVLSNYNYKPLWLSEGLATYLSTQLPPGMRQKKFSKFLAFYNNGGKEVYEESGFVVEILIGKFGKGKLLKLIKNLKPIHDEDKFKKLFKRIYGFELNYDEINRLYQNKK